MSTADGSVIGVTEILNNGSPAERFNIVILSEGYQTAQLPQFANDAQAFVTRLSQTAPYHLVMNSINVYRVDVSSTDSGADDPVACGGSGATARTYFDATFCGDGVNQRLCNVNVATVQTVAKAQVPQYLLAIVIVNSPIYGGSGGPVAVYSLAAPAIEIALHEMGHTAFGFADEYATYQGCSSGETGHDVHPPGEPPEPNITLNGNDRSSLKWGRFVLPATNLPTTKNANCTQCDPQASPVPTGTVGTFEGADYYHCGAFRPEYDCRMRNLGVPFCRVCQDVILHKLEGYSPLNKRFVWKGVGGDQNIYFGWGGDSDQYELSQFGTSAGPAVTDFSGTLMAWKGAYNDQRIWYSRQTHIDGVTWDPQYEIPGVGTSTGPAMAVFRNKLHMAWKGIFNDQGIYFTTMDINGGWAPQASVPGVGTSTRPSLAVFGDRLYMAWKGIAGDQGIYFTSFDGSNWAPQASVPGVGTSTYPTLAVLGNRLFMVWKGIEGDPSIYWTSFDGSWQAHAPLPNAGTTTGATLAPALDRLFLVWSGVAPDESLYYTTFSGGFWGPQHNYLNTGSSSVPGLLIYS
jgi:hypothetical protein